MKPISFIAAALLILCNCNISSTKKYKELSKKEKKVLCEEYRIKLQGKWSWESDTSFKYVIDGDSSFYISEHHNDKKDVFILKTKNCNANARYDSTAKRMIGHDPIYINTWKLKDGKPYSRRCLAIIYVEDEKLSLLDTENGSILNYKK